MTTSERKIVMKPNCRIPMTSWGDGRVSVKCGDGGRNWNSGIITNVYGQKLEQLAM